MGLNYYTCACCKEAMTDYDGMLCDDCDSFICYNCIDERNEQDVNDCCDDCSEYMKNKTGSKKECFLKNHCPICVIKAEINEIKQEFSDSINKIYQIVEDDIREYGDGSDYILANSSIDKLKKNFNKYLEIKQKYFI
jgi:hypothetical protein